MISRYSRNFLDPDIKQTDTMGLGNVQNVLLNDLTMLWGILIVIENRHFLVFFMTSHHSWWRHKDTGGKVVYFMRYRKLFFFSHHID